jgi:hypothetical protein
MNATDRNDSGWEGAVPEEDPKVRRPAWKIGWTPVRGSRPALDRDFCFQRGKIPVDKGFFNLRINQGIPGSF